MGFEIIMCRKILNNLKKKEWNKGYATEAAKACINYAKEQLSFKTIFSFTSLTNISSERVMQKIGMQKIKIFPHPTILDGHPLKEHVLYKLVLSNNN